MGRNGDVLTMPAGADLDRMADAIISGHQIVAVLPSRSWSTDANAVDAVYDPLAKAHDWCLGYDASATSPGRRGFIVLDKSNSVIGQATTAIMARLRAVLAWHLANTKRKKGAKHGGDNAALARSSADDVASQISHVR